MPTLSDVIMDDIRPSDSHMDRLHTLMNRLYPLIDSGDIPLTERVIATLVFALPEDSDIMADVERDIEFATRRLA